ncbi:MAG: serine hydrolase [Flavobacteriales bacterium]|nr:serine hydrolase [Flavobacteriales bacterium]
MNISWSGAAGHSEKGAENILEVDDPALIASCIKTYVSAAILRLVEEGELSLSEPISPLLTDRSRQLFDSDGYDLNSIQVQHLLSHTSGVNDYVSDEYLTMIEEDKSHRWTKNEQLELAISSGDPLAEPGKLFDYADANYLLLAEIIENKTNKPYYTSIRQLLKFDELEFSDSWFPTLEERPAETNHLVHQYWTDQNWDSYDIDVSFDLYGGGGMATTAEDLADFGYHLFHGDIIEDEEVLNSIYTDISTAEGRFSPYYLGLSEDSYQGMKGYGHGGFWGTVFLYFPDLDASVSVFVLERDKRKLRRDILGAVTAHLKKSITKK